MNFEINPGCAAYNPIIQIFCVTGSYGVATSYDCEHWEIHQDVPHNLIDLQYREDLKNFMAFSPEENLFYLSSDGWTWEKVSDVPVPLENLSSVTYCPELQWYCAAGKQTTYYTFSPAEWTND